MRTIIALDDDLMSQARDYTGLKETAAIVHEALRALIQHESARRLAALGGSESFSKRRRAAVMTEGTRRHAVCR